MLVVGSGSILVVAGGTRSVLVLSDGNVEVSVTIVVDLLVVEEELVVDMCTLMDNVLSTDDKMAVEEHSHPVTKGQM